MANLAERLAHASQHGEHDEALSTDAVAALTASTSTADTRLAAARYLDAADNDDGRHDRAIVDALDPLLEREASFPNAARYLEATHTLAGVALRHQRWSIASNALLVLDSRLPEDEVPAWVRCFRTKLFFRLDPEAAFGDPRMTLELLGPFDQLDTQGRAVVREYLALARDRFRTLDADDARARFVDDASGLVQPILASVVDLWQQLQTLDAADDDDDVDDLTSTLAAGGDFLPRRPAAPPAPKRSVDAEEAAVPSQPSFEEPGPVSDDQRAEHDDEVTADAFTLDAALDAPGAPDADPRTLAALNAEVEQLREQLARREAESMVGASPPELVADSFDTVEGDTFTLGRRHLLVLGAIRPSPTVFQGIAKRYGISKDQLVFKTDYDKLRMFDLESLRYSHQCAGVVIGAVPHKMRNVGTETSAIELLRNGDGFPPSVPMYAGRELKGTKTSFRRALEELRDQMRASGAPTVRGAQDVGPMQA